MAMSNQECIEYLEGFDRLKNMDPKIRKIIIDRAVKGIRTLDQKVDEGAKLAKKFNDVRALSNRYHALTFGEVNAYMAPDKLGKPIPEEVFLKNVLLIFCEARNIGMDKTPTQVLDSILDLYASALKPLCRFTHGGAMCPFCGIKDCEMNAAMCTEEQEKMKAEIMKQIEEEAKK